jgi:hypothetical protein
MDPRITEIYGQDPHSVGWWVGFLTIAVLLTFVLIGIFLIGVTKAYEGTDEVTPSPEPIPLDGPEDEAAPQAVETAADANLTGVG